MKARSFTILVAITILVPALAVASQGPPGEPGLPRACDRSENDNPCRRVIPDTIVGPGKERIYTGNYTATGTVTVLGGGIATVVDANITFQDTSDGFIAEPGAILRFIDSDLLEASGSSYSIVAKPGSNFTLNDTLVRGGEGVKVATSTVSITGSTLRDIPLALKLTDVTATIHHNAFIGNTVAINQTGGQPTLSDNSFSGGEVCVQDWRVDPTIVNNVFRGCHVGIYHEESHSVISGNDMRDDAVPPGTGIFVINGQSPTVENNIIRDYGTGIRIQNARAYVRNNTIETSVGHGIFVDANSAPMDIQGNLVRWNGGDGIRIRNANDIPVFDNVVRENGGDGIRLENVVDVPLTGNLVEENGGAGIVVTHSAFASLVDNVASANEGAGLVLTNASDATLEGNSASGNAQGFLLDADSRRASLTDNAARENLGAGFLVRGDEAQIEGGLANGNGGHGIYLNHALDVVVADLTANGNGADGVRLAGSRGLLERVNASGNAANGFTYDPMGPFELLATELTFVRALGNGGSGLHNIEGNATSVHDAWWEGNAFAGVRNDDPIAIIDATQNYWGSATGPTHVLNPLGTGDAVVGGVLYVPFLTAPPAEPASDAAWALRRWI